jgi:tetrahydromethanopterin S-methyltransferase subunit B
MTGGCIPTPAQMPVSKYDASYWRTRPIEERMDELEALREQYIRTLPPEHQKFQRVISYIGTLRDAP